MKIQYKIAITLIVVAICFWFLFPTIKWTMFTSQEDKALVSLSAGEVKLRAIQEQDSLAFREKVENLKKTSAKSLQLGLDLKGGMSILLDVDIEQYEETIGRKISESEASDLINQDIEVLKTRIDQFGLSEPEIRKQGNSQIIIELAGSPDPERVETFLRGKGSLAFHLVDNAATYRVQQYYINHSAELYNEDGTMKDVSLLKCPVLGDRTDRKIAMHVVTDEYGIESTDGFYVIYSSPALDGNYLLDAQSQKDNMNQTVVALRFSDEGGNIFYEFTSKNVGSLLAIVMDGKIRSAATIREPLRSNVQISGFSVQEAEDLAVLLKTANLPAQVRVAGMQSVGASLGEDAVSTGIKAIIAGFVLVVIFMVVIYGICGIVADTALIFNMVIIVAVMGGFGSTLTLTGIAGIILTLGMAVDANVIIFERIKEELSIGVNAKKAVEAGFSKALWTILDSNITTIIAAVVLIIFGSSTVKGFATTLAIGIVSSVFTSLFVSHMLFDIIVKDKISIGRPGRYR